MEQFEKWFEKEGEKVIDNYQNHYSTIKEVVEDAWIAALGCVRDEMLSNCEEDFMELYSFISKELTC